VDSEVRRTRLPNGIRVVTEAIPDARTVTLGIWVETGTRFEPPEWAGISHFVEHMLFKGTRRRSAQQIAEEVDALGGQLNAFTDRELTCYYVRVLADHLPRAAEILADMLVASVFDPEAIEKERQVILEEIKMYEDSPDDLVQDLFLETLWAGDPLGRPVIGTAHTVRRLRREAFLEYMAREYVPGRTLVAASGAVQHEAMVTLVQDLLAPLDGAALPRTLRPPEVRREVKVREKDTEQVHLCFGYPGLPQAHPDRYVQAVLETIAGGGMSSRLFQEIREKRGLVYSIGTFSAMYREAGALAVYAGTSPERVGEVLGISLRELERLREEPVPEEELRRAKESLKGSLMLSLEGTAPRMFYLARSELYLGRYVSPDEILAEVEGVTAERVQRLARELLSGPPTLAAVGPEGADRLVRGWFESVGVVA
jgi:predicted Zn-dependent peptidase